MTRALTRTHFHSSRLIRTLADLAVLETTEPAVDFAQKLGLWIGFTDAIALSGLHNAKSTSPPDTRSAAPDVAGRSLHDTFTTARCDFENTIRKSSLPDIGSARPELTLPKLDGPHDDAAAYVPFRRYHQAHQRDMETKVRSLRAKLRDGVAKASPALGQLVALDAAFDGILRGREGKLLSTLPSLLEARFNHLRQAHLLALQPTPQTSDPDGRTHPGAWLARFSAELQAVLLAELDLRLQPAIGLLEAFNREQSPNL